MRDVTQQECLDLLEQAYGVIANVGHRQGGWPAQHPEWVAAAEKWRDAWHEKVFGRTFREEMQRGNKKDSP